MNRKRAVLRKYFRRGVPSFHPKDIYVLTFRMLIKQAYYFLCNKRAQDTFPLVLREPVSRPNSRRGVTCACKKNYNKFWFISKLIMHTSLHSRMFRAIPENSSYSKCHPIKIYLWSSSEIKDSE